MDEFKFKDIDVTDLLIKHSQTENKAERDIAFTMDLLQMLNVDKWRRNYWQGQDISVYLAIMDGMNFTWKTNLPSRSPIA